MEPISSSPLEPAYQESESEIEEIEESEDEVEGDDSEDLQETDSESSEIEIIIAEVLDFTDSETDLDNYPAFLKLKRRLEGFNQAELPEKVRSRLKLANDNILRVSKIKFLIKDSKNATDKAKAALINVTKALEEMEHGMDQMALKREKERRILPLVSRLVDIRNRMFIEHAKDIQKYPDLVKALKEINEILDQIEDVDITTARALHGLHFEGDLPVGFERIIENTIREYQQLNALTLVGEKTSAQAQHTFKKKPKDSKNEDSLVSHNYATHTGKKIESLNLEKNQSSIYLRAVNTQTTKEVFNLIKNDVKQFTHKAHYNTWQSVNDFIDFYHTFNPPLKSSEAFRRFNPHEDRMNEFGSAYSGQSIEIVKHLSEKFHLQGFPLVQREGKFGIPKHAASIIPCRDGILLIEMLNKDQPIIAVRPSVKNHAPFFEDHSIFEIDSSEGPYAKLIRRSETKLPDGSIKIIKTEFPLEELSLRDVMLRYIIDRFEYPLMSVNHDYSILVNIQDGKIVFKKIKGNVSKSETFEFKDLDSSKLDKLLDKFYRKIAMSKIEVKAMLRKFAENQDVVKNLLIKTLSPLPL